MSYDEIIFLDGKIQLINQDRNLFSLDCIDFETLCSITDRLSTINPYTAKERPLHYLSDSMIDLSNFPNFSVTGSIKGMKKQYYGKGALLVQFGEYIYNVTTQPEIYFEHSDKQNEY